jgi:hypothetical protein
MTSWNRGKENEEMGERELSDGDPSNNVEGLGRKIAGETEQGLDNVGDTLSGKQRDLEGYDRNKGKEFGEFVEHRGEDIQKESTD